MDFLYGLIPDRIRNISTYMDFEGQKQAERYFQVIILLFAVVGFGWGYICQQFSQTVYILFAGFILSCLLTLPPWPMYRRKPLKWQPAQHFADSDTEATESSPAVAASAPSKNKKKNK